MPRNNFRLPFYASLALLCAGMTLLLSARILADEGEQQQELIASAPAAEEPRTDSTLAPAQTAPNQDVSAAKVPQEEQLAPFEGMIGDKQARYVGTETCAACHEKEAKEFKKSAHSRISLPDESSARQGCEMCHGPGSVHAENGGGKGTMINPNKNPEICFTCHMDKKAEFRLPYHHPVLEGHMACSDCHSAHGEEVRPWSATSMNDVNEACFKCHKDQRGPFVWEHEGIREGCVTCHKVHGSIHQKMLISRDSNLCLRCHAQVNFPVIGKRSHSGFLPQGPCFSGGCHTAVHGSQFDDHLRY